MSEGEGVIHKGEYGRGEGGGGECAFVHEKEERGESGRLGGKSLAMYEGEEWGGTGEGEFSALSEGEGGGGESLAIFEGEEREGKTPTIFEEERRGGGGEGEKSPAIFGGEERRRDGGESRGGEELSTLCEDGRKGEGERTKGEEGEGEREGGRDTDNTCPLDDYTWVPPGLNPQQVYSYFRCLPDDRVPHLNSEGQKWRIRQLLQQLPPHDSDVRHCTALSDTEKQELRMFSAFRKRKAFGRGDVTVLPLTSAHITICEKCREVLKGGEMAVCAVRAGRGRAWHPVCFTCCTCGELLVDLLYFQHQGLLYCGRHHAERFKPRCAACDEIIFADECTEAEGKSWHLWHFSCLHCQRQLGGQRYMLRQSAAFCCTCFDQLFAYFCDTCGDRIGLDQGHMTYDGQHWHASPACFKCHTCQMCLLGQPFLPKSGVIYCCVACSGAGCMQTQTPRRWEDYGPDLPPAAAAARLTSPLSHVLQEGGGGDIRQLLRERYTLPDSSLTSSDRDQGYATSSASDVHVLGARSRRQSEPGGEDGLCLVNVRGTLNAPSTPQEARTRHRLSQFSAGDLSPPSTPPCLPLSPLTYTYTTASESVSSSSRPGSRSGSESGTGGHYASISVVVGREWSKADQLRGTVTAQQLRQPVTAEHYRQLVTAQQLRGSVRTLLYTHPTPLLTSSQGTTVRPPPHTHAMTSAQGMIPPRTELHTYSPRPPVTSASSPHRGVTSGSVSSEGRSPFLQGTVDPRTSPQPTETSRAPPPVCPAPSPGLALLPQRADYGYIQGHSQGHRYCVQDKPSQGPMGSGREETCSTCSSSSDSGDWAGQSWGQSWGQPWLRQQDSLPSGPDHARSSGSGDGVGLGQDQAGLRQDRRRKKNKQCVVS